MEMNKLPQIGTILFSKDFKIVGINSVARKVLNFEKGYFGKDLKQLHPQKAQSKIGTIIKQLQGGRENVTVTMLVNVLGKVLLLNTTRLEITSKDDIVFVMNFVDISKATGAEINKKTGLIEVKKIPVFYKNSIIYLNQSDIYFIKSEENYCHIYTRQKEYFVRSSLRELTFNFTGTRLLRVHKQFIVNLEHIKKIELQENRQALAWFYDEKVPPVTIARRKVKEVKELLKKQPR